MLHLSTVHLSSIKLTGFKNYEQQSLSFSSRLNCLTGLNGMGKTNVLDAIHFLCLCKSHTGLSDKHMVRHGESFFRLEGLFQADDERIRIITKFIQGQRKEIERNGVAFTRLTDYIGQFPVVMIAPDDVALVQDGSEERRRFLDNTLSQISANYLQNLLIYNALLKQRNALLKKFAEDRFYDESLIEGLNRQMPAPAAVLFQQRSVFVESFRPLFLEYYREISGGHEFVEISFESDLQDVSFDQLLKNNTEKDRVLQRTSAGPHRDDLLLIMDEQPVRKFASQGQIKSFLLAMRLAQYELLRREKGFAPVLLLDDIFDKLDEQRVRHLIGLLIGRSFGQIFITDTQRSRLEGIVASFTGDYSVFEVKEGVVQ